MKIDQEFQSLLPTLSEQEYNLLKESILEQGILNPIIFWKEEDIIIDGHNRHSIYTANKKELKNKGLDRLPIERLSFSSREAVVEWVIKTQLGRRNLSYSRWKYYLGILYNQTKHQGTCGKNYPNKRTAEVLAQEYNVSEKTVRNAGKFATNLDVINQKAGSNNYGEQILNGKIKLSDKQIEELVNQKYRDLHLLVERIVGLSKTDEDEIQLYLINNWVKKLKKGLKKINKMEQIDEVKYLLKSVLEEI